MKRISTQIIPSKFDLDGKWVSFFEGVISVERCQREER